MKKYLYGFKNINTKLFRPSYRTIQATTKTACFRTKKNAEKALAIQPYKNCYFICEMVCCEDLK